MNVGCCWTKKKCLRTCQYATGAISQFPPSIAYQWGASRKNPLVENRHWLLFWFNWNIFVSFLLLCTQQNIVWCARTYISYYKLCTRRILQHTHPRYAMLQCRYAGIMKTKWTGIISLRRLIYCINMNRNRRRRWRHRWWRLWRMHGKFTRYLLKWSLPTAYCYC